MIVNTKDLKKNNFGNDYKKGYRIVYFYNNSYDIGEYCSTIEGFMIGFAECDPIMSDEDIPKFISTEDLINRYLKEISNVSAVAIYNVNGECIDKIYKQSERKKL